jgi:hypothetical protein
MNKMFQRELLSGGRFSINGVAGEYRSFWWRDSSCYGVVIAFACR